MTSSFEGTPDVWTGMQWPSEVEADKAGQEGARPEIKESRFDIKSFFWKYIAAGSSTTPHTVLELLSQDPRLQIRRRVAENLSAPEVALERLAQDPADAVRHAVAKNRKTPAAVLRNLIHDDNVDVRFALAGNPDAPDAILLSLFLDPDPVVADRASENLAA